MKIELTIHELKALISNDVLPKSVSMPTILEWSHTLCDGERVTYEDAEKAAAALGEGWRLPTRLELESLLDLSRHNPAIDIVKYPFTKSVYYWTSTVSSWDSFAVWVVNFSHGDLDSYPRDNLACVRAVREALLAGEKE